MGEGCSSVVEGLPSIQEALDRRLGPVKKE